MILARTGKCRLALTPLAVADAKRLQDAIAAKLDLEDGAKQALHAGRVPGFPNGKPGRAGYVVRLAADEPANRVADAAALTRLIASLAPEPVRTRLPVRPPIRQGRVWPEKSLAEFHGDARYGGDKSRADLAWSLYALDKMGWSPEDVARHINVARRAEGDTRKGRLYGDRTVTRAQIILDRQAPQPTASWER